MLYPIERLLVKLKQTHDSSKRTLYDSELANGTHDKWMTDHNGFCAQKTANDLCVFFLKSSVESIMVLQGVPGENTHTHAVRGRFRACSLHIRFSSHSAGHFGGGCWSPNFCSICSPQWCSLLALALLAYIDPTTSIALQ